MKTPPVGSEELEISRTRSRYFYFNVEKKVNDVNKKIYSVSDDITLYGEK